jgi:sulfur relay (sulfurtransferase) DsrC/TusE family protein
VAENYKTIETEKELLMEKAHDLNREFVRQEEKKNNIVRLAEEEWKNVKEARENSGKGVKNGWLFFKEEESNAVELSEEEWKIIHDTREKNTKRGWFF